MQPMNDILIPVQREWNGWKSTEVRLGDLQDVHWLQPNGTSHPFVHAYVRCTPTTSAAFPHGCSRAPHRLLVCILKRHTIPTVYAELARRADAQRMVVSKRYAVLSATPSTV